MKAITWLASATAVVGLTASAFASPLEGWTDDLDQALETAKKENKAVLVDFTGSDWCPPCILMRKRVYSQKEFVEEASKNFVLVEIDFPKGDVELGKKNMALDEKYDIQGKLPTVVLLDSDGNEFTRFFGALHPTIPAYLAHLEASLEKMGLD